MFATEPFGTWGPGPVPEPVGYWARILDSVANDPRAVATIIAAFLGFFFAAWSKYLFDLRRDRLRRETDRQILGTALSAELLDFDVKCKSRIDAFEELLKENPEMEVLGGPHSFARMALPPRRVWVAHLGRIGELKGVDPKVLMLAHSSFDSYDLAVETLKQQADGQGVSREALQDRVNQLKLMREAIVIVGGPLVEQTKVRPSWWRRILRL